MIIGIGTDIVNISRIEESINKFGAVFLDRCFTKAEIAESMDKKDNKAYFAKRFAVKEAFFKALGTGFTHGVSWQDVEVENDKHGKPHLNISGRSREILNDLASKSNMHLSISDDKPFAVATVIIEEG